MRYGFTRNGCRASRPLVSVPGSPRLSGSPWGRRSYTRTACGSRRCRGPHRGAQDDPLVPPHDLLSSVVSAPSHQKRYVRPRSTLNVTRGAWNRSVSVAPPPIPDVPFSRCEPDLVLTPVRTCTASRSRVPPFARLVGGVRRRGGDTDPTTRPLIRTRRGTSRTPTRRGLVSSSFRGRRGG